MERDVGVCGSCGGPVRLRLGGQCRVAVCPCGSTVIPAPFFAANAAMRRGPLRELIVHERPSRA